MRESKRPCGLDSIKYASFYNPSPIPVSRCRFPLTQALSEQPTPLFKASPDLNRPHYASPCLETFGRRLSGYTR